MIFFAQGGGGGGEGGKGHGRKALPPVSPWSACFLLFLRKGFFQIFVRAQKYWRETHLLDPLAVSIAGRGGSSIGVSVGGSNGGMVGDGASSRGSLRQLIVVNNAMIFLRISDGTFVEAGNPLLARY